MDKKSIFLALFIFIIIALAFYFTLQEAPLNNEQPPNEEQKRAAEELEDVSFTLYNQEKNQEIKIDSKNVLNYKDKQRMDLEPLYAEVYAADSGELLYTLEGDFARYFTARDYLEVRDNVVVDSKRYHIVSDELDYYINKNYVEGRGAVKITGSDFVSTADSFRSDLNLRDLKLSEKDDEQIANIRFDNFNQDSEQNSKKKESTVEEDSKQEESNNNE